MIRWKKKENKKGRSGWRGYVLALALAIPVTLGAPGADTWAATEKGTEAGQVTTAGEMTVTGNVTVGSRMLGATADSGTSTSAFSIEDAGLMLREKMKQRITSIRVIYETDGDYGDINTLGRRVLASAFAYTGKADEGDYIALQVENVNYTLECQVSGSHSKFIFDFTVSYYINAQQEAEFEADLADVLQSLNIPDSASEYEKVCTIYDYVCRNVSYDSENMNNDAYDLKFTAYAALENGKAVCNGYALLMYRMLLESGVDARIIEGYGNSNAHAWNIVKIGDIYYNLDATWDADFYTGIENTDFFLKGETSFASGHSRRDGRYDYTGDAYKAAYPVSENDYQPESGCEHNWEVKRVTDSTCKAEGSTLYRCTKCGTEKSESIAKKDHTTVKDPAVAATCTTAGKTEGSHCSVCGTVIKAQQTVSAKGHTAVTDAAVAATCTKAGKTEGSHCSVCGTVIKAQQTVKAKGHTVVTDPAVAATYTKTGKTEGSHCSVCGTVIKAQTVVPKLVKEGLVTESGNTFYYKNGKKQTGWQQINKKWYFFNSSGVMQTGWMKQGGKWYYLGTDGAMVTGWKQISKKWYYFKSSGEMAANEWCKGYWLNKDGTWTFKTKAAWKKDSVGWWFGYSGWYAKSQWQKIDDKWYYFDAKGHIVTGTRTIGGKTYRFNASGVCLNP